LTVHLDLPAQVPELPDDFEAERLEGSKVDCRRAGTKAQVALVLCPWRAFLNI